MKKNGMSFAAGLLAGALIFGGATAAAAGLTAELSANPIYVDGRQVQMTAYKIGGNNYVKLRDVGKAVGFNVYWQNGVQIDSDAPYTGEAPVQGTILTLSSYAGNTLNVGDRSALIIKPDTGKSTAVSSNTGVAALEQVSGKWVIVAKTAGTATITVTNSTGETGRLTVTVQGSAAVTNTIAPSGSGLTANMEIRQEMIRLINEVRRKNGVAELTVNEALMNAAQDTSMQKFEHHNPYEFEAAHTYGYPYGVSVNLTWFNRAGSSNIAERAIQNWIDSTGHFQTMTAARYDSLGVGVTVSDDIAYCYMFVGNPNGINP